MIITKMSLPRRTFLHGMGATIALPLLDAMVPALSALNRTAAKPIQRLGFIYLPNGQHLPAWRPKGEGTNFEFQTTLKALEPYRKYLTVVSQLSNLQAEAKDLSTGPHTRAGSVWLCGVRPKRTEGADIQSGKTLDQYAADVLGTDTSLRSLELALESNFNVGNCDNGYSCTYVNTFSWRTPTTPLPMEHDPRVVFERLFGDGSTVEARRAELRTDRSILDGLTGEMTRLKKALGPQDRNTVNEYLEALRDVERRIQRAEQHSADSTAPTVPEPTGIPDSHIEHSELMHDLLFLAYQADITRVASFQIGREQSSQTYPWIGVPEEDHDISHVTGPEKAVKRTKQNTFRAEQFARFLQKMATTPDGDGMLLDHALILYGAGMGDANVHSPHDLPLLVAGTGCGQLQGGRHLVYPFDTPMMNLGVSLLEKAGVAVDKVGDSTGRLVDF